jgi:hypothetical protein
MAAADDFEMAMRVFDLFTLAERKEALRVFADLRYPLLTDRFYEAVYSVIREKDRQTGVE